VVGWFLLLPRETSTSTLVHYMNAWIRKYIGPNEPIVGAEWRKIWHGQAGDKHLSEDQKKFNFAVHVVVARGHEYMTSQNVHTYIQSNAWKSITNIRTKLVQAYDANKGEVFRDHSLHAQKRHIQFLRHTMGRATASNFTSPYRVSSLYKDGTTKKNLVQLAMTLKLPGSTMPAFLAINIIDYGMDIGQYAVTYPKAYEAAAQEMLLNLAAYFTHLLGKDSLEWFTEEAQERAEGMEWDEEKGRPISREALDLEDFLDNSLLAQNDWANLGDIDVEEDDLTNVVSRPAKVSEDAPPKKDIHTDVKSVFSFFGKNHRRELHDDETTIAETPRAACPAGHHSAAPAGDSTEAPAEGVA
jgi:hypothetical protein